MLFVYYNGGNMKKFFIVITMSFLILSSIYSYLIVDKVYSEIEFRKLSQKPKVKSVKDIGPTKIEEFDEYFMDQYFFRNQAVSFSSSLERLTGKKIRRGFYVREDNLVLTFNDYKEKNKLNEEKMLQEYFQLVDTIKMSSDSINANFLYYSIPYKYDFYTDKYPSYVVNNSSSSLEFNQEVINNFQKNGIKTLNGDKFLKQFENEKIYYDTDTHFNSKGALYSYYYLMNDLNLFDSSIPDFSQYKTISYVSPFYGNNARALSDIKLLNHEKFEYHLPKSINKIEDLNYIRYEEGKESDLPIMVPDKDTAAYGNFMSGDKANTKIINLNKNNGYNILFIGDSFTNALEFYSVFDFNEIHSLDLRHYKGDVNEYIKNNPQIDYVVFVRHTMIPLLKGAE